MSARRALAAAARVSAGLVVVGADVGSGRVVVGRYVVVVTAGTVVVVSIVVGVAGADKGSSPERTRAAETPVPGTNAASTPTTSGSGRSMSRSVSLRPPGDKGC